MPMIETTGGTSIHYEIQGGGPPLLLLSGTGHDHTFWGGQLPFFAPKFTVITIDNRGVGSTVVPSHDYSLVVEILDPASRGRACIVHEDINTAQCRRCFIDHAGDIVGIAHVAGNANHPPAGVAARIR